MLFSKFVIWSRRLNGHFVCMTFRERQNSFDFSTQFKRYAPLNADPRPYRPQEPFLSTIRKKPWICTKSFQLGWRYRIILFVCDQHAHRLIVTCYCCFFSLSSFFFFSNIFYLSLMLVNLYSNAICEVISFFKPFVL